jgi:ribonuclease HII
MNLIVGIDEVGRGCLAGPLVVGAVVLEKRIRGLKDSKLLTREQREALDKRIRDRALCFGLGWVPAAEVDRLGLTKATQLAAEQALTHVTCEYTEIIIDGNFNFLKDNPKSHTLIKADMTVPAVSAASIIAKVARDNYMIEIAKKFPQYQFEKHVGYGTKLHREMLALYCVCELHRISWRPFQTQAELNV